MGKKRFLGWLAMLVLAGAIVSHGADIEPLKEGSRVPGITLKDQDGSDFRFEDLKGKFAVLTFIYSRCAVPTFCPMMSKNFRELQDSLRGDESLAGKVHLLSVSIDPAFDTPEILKGYANHFAIDTKDWSFLTGDERTVKGLAGAFSVFVDQADDGSLDHTLTTALIGPDGQILKLWKGNRWTSEDVIKEFRGVSAEETAEADSKKDSH